MNRIFRTFLPFACGGVAVFNLAKLVDTNQNYQPEWWKVAVALIVTVLVGAQKE